MIKQGDWIETPRFLKVKIAEVFEDNSKAWDEGYTEPTHYRGEEYHIRGKNIGENRMVFAAIRRM